MVKLSTKKIALVAVYAAMLAVVSRLPGIPILVGGKSGSIELTVMLYPIVGILFGPYIGALAALMGNIVIFLIPKMSVFGLLTIPAGALSALVAGFLTTQDRQFNWKAAATVLGVMIICWFVPWPNPVQAYVGLEAPLYPLFLHVPALVLILVLRGKIAELISSSKRRATIIGVAIASYVGLMADLMWGNLMFAYLFFPYYVDLKAFRDFIRAITQSGKALIGMGGISPKTILNSHSGIGDYFMFMLPVQAVERIIFLVIAVFIGVAVVRMIGGYLESLNLTPLKLTQKAISSERN